MLKKGQLAIIFFVVAVCVALYLNWAFLSPEKTDDSQIAGMFDNASGDNNSNDGSLGDALLVDNTASGDNVSTISTSGSSDAYFAQARLNRKQGRDEALEILQSVIDNPNATSASKDDSAKEISVMANNVAKEVNIENVLTAKGFKDCMATVNSDDVVVMVKISSGSITSAQVAQIRDVVLDETDVSVDNIRVVEVK
jgi:stage III sporulation protein AH